MAPPSKQLDIHPDAAFREVGEQRARAEKAEAELAALKAQVAAAATPPPKQLGVVPGVVTYRLAQPHYRRGAWYQAGDTITVTDEKPGKTWVRVDAKAAAVAAPVESPAKSRPSDISL